MYCSIVMLPFPLSASRSRLKIRPVAVVSPDEALAVAASIRSRWCMAAVCSFDIVPAFDAAPSDASATRVVCAITAGLVVALAAPNAVAHAAMADDSNGDLGAAPGPDHEAQPANARLARTTTARMVIMSRSSHHVGAPRAASASSVATAAPIPRIGRAERSQPSLAAGERQGARFRPTSDLGAEEHELRLMCLSFRAVPQNIGPDMPANLERLLYAGEIDQGPRIVLSD